MQLVSDETDRKNLDAMRGAVDGFFTVQDKVLEASRKAESDPKADELARALLLGESRQAIGAVRARRANRATSG